MEPLSDAGLKANLEYFRNRVGNSKTVLNIYLLAESYYQKSLSNLSCGYNPAISGCGRSGCNVPESECSEECMGEWKI
jgi:hypothetical protein